MLTGILAAVLLVTDVPMEQVQTTHTDHIDFPSTGVLKLEHSTGELSIEAWDQPGIEITAIRSTKSWYVSKRDDAVKKLDQIKMKTDRQRDQVTITTEFPKHDYFTRIFRGVSEFELEYIIKVPAAAKLDIEHDSGDVNIYGVTGDLHVKNGMGQINVHVPQDGHYAIDAKCDLGAINSDFGDAERGKVIHKSMETKNPPAGAQKLYARQGFGDIVIQKIQIPSFPMTH